MVECPSLVTQQQVTGESSVDVPDGVAILFDDDPHLVDADLAEPPVVDLGEAEAHRSPRELVERRLNGGVALEWGIPG